MYWFLLLECEFCDKDQTGDQTRGISTLSLLGEREGVMQWCCAE